ERKHRIVKQLYQGVQTLMKKNNIHLYEGIGRILGPSIFSPSAGTISVEMNNGDENTMLVPNNVLAATGSRPKGLPGLDIDGDQIMMSEEAGRMDLLSVYLIIVGGGSIGVEWTSMFSDFGVRVSILEFVDRILSAEDRDIDKEMTHILKEKNVTV